LPLSNTGTTATSFHAAGKYSWVRLKLDICLTIGIKIFEQPFMIEPGISSTPADFEGFSLLMALQTSALEMGQGIKFRKLRETGKVHRAVVIINRLKVLSESINNCIGLEQVCTINI
jgi:hypothetical protein